MAGKPANSVEAVCIKKFPFIRKTQITFVLINLKIGNKYVTLFLSTKIVRIKVYRIINLGEKPDYCLSPNFGER
jgi:hypothetical protein